MNSMTGSGRAVLSINEELKYVVFMSSLNHRYLDINLYLPEELREFEIRIRDFLKRKIRRGSVVLRIYKEENEHSNKDLSLNLDVINKYLSFQKDLHNLGIKGELSIEFLLSRNHAIESGKGIENLKMDEDKFYKAINAAIEDMLYYRVREGQALKEDFLLRIGKIENLLESIKYRLPLRREEKIKQINKKIAEINVSFDKQRMEEEILYHVERMDITEECVRLNHHINIFKETLEQEGSIGKRLQFIVQELVKETNTIGSKANDAQIAEDIIKIKEEIEKIREQVLNVE